MGISKRRLLPLLALVAFAVTATKGQDVLATRHSHNVFIEFFGTSDIISIEVI